MSPPRLLVVAGPTAVGKSAIALRVAEQLEGEIVNADALQVYRGFDVGTAKPSREERQRVRHHLIDILDPPETYSAAAFARRARAAVAVIERRGGLPVVVGGSGLYLRAFLQGLSPLPPVPARLRDGLEAQRLRRGLAPLRRALELLDPAIAARLAPGDRQRTLRALGVTLASGRPFSHHLATPPVEGSAAGALKIGLTLPRAVLYDRIADRAARMVSRGWVDEVGRLLEAGLDPALPAFQAIGYRQLARFHRGEWSLQEAMEDTIRATRRFAKRQLTWFRREPGISWHSALDPERAVTAILEAVRAHGLFRRAP